MRIWGLHPLEQLLRVRPQALERIWVVPTFGRRQRQARLLAALSAVAVAVERVERLTPEIVPPKAVHQGVAAEVTPFWNCDFAELVTHGGLMVACDQMEDPHNLGAVLRSCAAFGVTGVILPGRRGARVNGTVVKASSGGVFSLRICQVANLAAALDRLSKEGIEVVGLSPDGDRSIAEISLRPPMVLVLGAEGKGLRPLVKRRCTILASIPMIRPMGSLNVSVAAGIALYQLQSGAGSEGGASVA